jgi:hypothetical protein
MSAAYSALPRLPWTPVTWSWHDDLIRTSSSGVAAPFDVRMTSNTLSQIVIGLASLSSKRERKLLGNRLRPLSRITMQIGWEAESGLAEIDERIADADRNISQIGTLIPELETKGYSTTNLERDLALMRTALHHLRAQRRTIVETWDEDEPLPRIARTTAPDKHRGTPGW